MPYHSHQTKARIANVDEAKEFCTKFGV